MGKQLVGLAVGLVGGLTSVTAGAQSTGAVGDSPPPVMEPTTTQVDTQSAPPPVAEPSRAPSDTDEGDAPVRRGPQKQVSLYMGSPIWLTDSPLDPGFEFEVRSGMKLGVLVPEIGMGARWNWFNVDKLAAQNPSITVPERYAGENLTGIWLSLGLRVEPNMKGSKVQPYFSLAFDANLWGFSYETTEICGFWSCGTVRQYDFAPGFSSRVGIRIEPNPRIGLDLGVKPAMTFQGWAFESTHGWIEPYGGITVLLDAASAGKRR
ncbi:MAG TPA: hypothetical protein VLC09_13885 [Polyangiaceae bacterium]|nr:hypothetical protein [Polyangiaceae bacterium]